MEKRLEQFLTEKALIDFLGVSKATISKLRHKNKLPYISVGGKRLYFEPDIIEWLLKNNIVEDGFKD